MQWKRTLKKLGWAVLVSTAMLANALAQDLHPYLAETREVFDDDYDQSAAEFRWTMQSALLGSETAHDILKSKNGFEFIDELETSGFLDAIWFAANRPRTEIPDFITLNLSDIKDRFPDRKLQWMRRADRIDLIIDFLVKAMIKWPSDEFSELRFSEGAAIKLLVDALQTQENSAELAAQHMTPLLNSIVQATPNSESKTVFLINAVTALAEIEPETLNPVVYDRLYSVMFTRQKSFASDDVYDRYIDALTILLPKLSGDERDRRADAMLKSLETSVFGVRAPFELIKLLGDVARLSPADRRAEILMRIEQIEIRDDFTETDKVFIRLEPLLGRFIAGEIAPDTYSEQLYEIWDPYLGDHSQLYLNAEVQDRTTDASMFFGLNQSAELVAELCTKISSAGSDPGSFDIYNLRDIEIYRTLFTTCLNSIDADKYSLLAILSYGFGYDERFDAFIVKFLEEQISALSGNLSERDAQSLVRIATNISEKADFWSNYLELRSLLPLLGKKLAEQPGYSDELVEGLWTSSFNDRSFNYKEAILVENLLLSASADYATSLFETHVRGPEVDRPDINERWFSDHIGTLVSRLPKDKRSYYAQELLDDLISAPSNTSSQKQLLQAMSALADANPSFAHQILNRAMEEETGSELQTRLVAALPKSALNDWTEAEARPYAAKILEFANAPGLDAVARLNRLAGLQPLGGKLSPQVSESAREQIFETIPYLMNRESMGIAGATIIQLWPNGRSTAYVRDWLAVRQMPNMRPNQNIFAPMERYIQAHHPQSVTEIATWELEDFVDDSDREWIRSTIISILQRQFEGLNKPAP